MLLGVGRECELVASGGILVRSEDPVGVVAGGQHIVIPVAVGGSLEEILYALDGYGLYGERPDCSVLCVLAHGDALVGVPAHSRERADDGHALDDDRW